MSLRRLLLVNLMLLKMKLAAVKMKSTNKSAVLRSCLR